MVSKVLGKRLTCSQLLAALESVEQAHLDPASATMCTLRALCEALTGHHDAMRDDEPVRVPDGSLPVTSAEVDEALAEVSQAEGASPSASAATRRVFKKARDLLAEVEKARALELAAVGAEYVTRQQLDDVLQVFALIIDNLERARERAGHADGRLSFRLQRIAESPAQFGLSRDEHKALRLFIALLDGAGQADARVERQRAAENATSCRGLNF